MIEVEKFCMVVEEHGWCVVEDAAWTWASALVDAEKVNAIERALAGRGVEGIEDLAIAGPDLGGVDGDDIAALLAFVEAELRAVELAA